MITQTDLLYVGVGALGIYLAHGIENKMQNPDESLFYNMSHINRVAFYWSLGALAFFILFKE